jgi:hypothetical protein
MAGHIFIPRKSNYPQIFRHGMLRRPEIAVGFSPLADERRASAETAVG